MDFDKIWQGDASQPFGPSVNKIWIFMKSKMAVAAIFKNQKS